MSDTNGLCNHMHPVDANSTGCLVCPSFAACATAGSIPKIESGPIFNFYMGKNTPERKDYIMDRLVVPVEE